MGQRTGGSSKSTWRNRQTKALTQKRLKRCDAFTLIETLNFLRRRWVWAARFTSPAQGTREQQRRCLQPSISPTPKTGTRFARSRANTSSSAGTRADSLVTQLRSSPMPRFARRWWCGRAKSTSMFLSSVVMSWKQQSSALRHFLLSVLDFKPRRPESTAPWSSRACCTSARCQHGSLAHAPRWPVHTVVLVRICMLG
jgi:hypothetical protein